MAREMSLISVTTVNSQTSTNNNSQISFSILDQWQVQYGRFVSYASCTFKSTHPSLTPILPSRRRGAGTWISTAAAFLKLFYHQNTSGSDDAVLVLSVGSRVVEEHYVSKMHFSWPQVSCVSGFPPRGSTTIFVSYRDDVGQIQKFALRFLTICETEKFVNILKEISKNETPLTPLKLLCSAHSELSSQAEIIPSNEPAYHRTERDWECTTSAFNSPRIMLPSDEFSPTEDSVSQEKTSSEYVPVMTMSEFPPSFTELLKNCDPVAVDKAKPTESAGDLKSQFMRYLEGTSFKELLATVEDVVSQLGDDILF